MNEKIKLQDILKKGVELPLNVSFSDDNRKYSWEFKKQILNRRKVTQYELENIYITF